MPQQKRPVGIIIVSLWSLLRAVVSCMSLYGTVIFLESALGMFGWPFSEIFAVAPLDQQIHLCFLFFQIALFLISAVGMFLGKNWARLGFIVASTASFLWSMYVVLTSLYYYGVVEKLYVPVNALLALFLALWYLNEERTLNYFGAANRFPDWSWLFYKIGRIPVTLALTLIFGILSVLMEGVGLFYLFQFGIL